MGNEITTFNLNYDMTLELTSEGKDVYDEYRLRDEIGTDLFPKINEGKVTLQGWRVMAIFGEMLSQGIRPFNMNVQLHSDSKILEKPVILKP